MLKRGHELVVDGPYRWVRYTIYTGLLIALVGTALAVGECRAVRGVATAGGAFWRKLKLEEALLLSRLPLRRTRPRAHSVCAVRARLPLLDRNT
jgi:protein-S-isoprenylcysteine O-methyltransferase Ste14